MKKRLRKSVLAVLLAILAALPAGPIGMPEELLGDVNIDNRVNIVDVTTLIQYLLNDSAPESALWLLDITGDGYFNISDVTALIDYLLTDEWKWPSPTPPLPENGWVFTVNGVSFAMIYVEPGTFTMGNDDVYGHNCRPAHQVTLTKGYWLGETEVTADLWYAVMGDSAEIATRGLQAAMFMNWYDIKHFIQKLNELTGMSFHLPSEAQWEFAARGGNLSQGYKYAGSDDINEVAWYEDNYKPHYAYVKTKAPNELGLYDMSGNAWEMVQDEFYNYSADPQIDPLYYYPQFPDNSHPTVRGGSYILDAGYCSVVARNGLDDWSKLAGIRLAL